MNENNIVAKETAPIKTSEFVTNLITIFLGLGLSVLISSIRYFCNLNSEDTIAYWKYFTDVAGISITVGSPIFTLLSRLIISKILPYHKDKNLSLFVSFKTTVGLSAIIINKKNEILLIKSKKDGKDFYEQPGTRYRINHFTQVINGVKDGKTFPSPISNLCETIKKETNISIANLELLHFFDGFNKLNLAVNSKGESLQNEEINENYKNNFILPPPFLIEMQDGNNINASGVSTMDLFYAFIVNEDGEEEIKDEVEFFKKDNIQRMIDTDNKNGSISIHHDIVIIINKFYKMLTQSRPKILFSTCRYTTHTNDYQQQKIEIVDVNNKTLNNLPQEVFVLRKESQIETTQDNLINCLDNFSNHIQKQKIIIDIEDMPKITTNDVSNWKYFSAEKRIELFQIRHSSSVINLKETKEKLSIYCDCIEYIINFEELLNDRQSVINNCQEMLIKQMRVLYDSDVEKIEEVHKFITNISGLNDTNYKIYSWFDRIIFVSRKCYKDNCENCKSRQENN